MGEASVDVFAEGSELVDLVLQRGGGYSDVNRAWMRFGWSHLAQAGLLPEMVEDEDWRYVDHAVTLVALAWVAQSFLDVAGGGWELDEVLVPSMVGRDRPGFALIELGRYCEREDIVAEQWPEPEHELMQEAIGARVPAVKAALRAQVGDAALFVSLVQLSEDEFNLVETSPGQWPSFDADVMSQLLSETETDRMHAWEWILE